MPRTEHVIAIAVAVLLDAVFAVAEPLKQGSSAPDFTLQRLDGKAKVSFKDEIKTNNRKAVMLAFVGPIGSWCKPCDPTALAIERERAKLEADNVHVIMAVYTTDSAESVAKAMKFVGEQKIGALVLADKDAGVESGKFGTETFPAVFIITPEGTIEASFLGGWDSKRQAEVFAVARAAAKPK